jgi:hypothetical protein
MCSIARTGAAGARNALLGAALFVLGWTGTSQAAVTLRVANRTGIRQATLERVESAIAFQANRQLRGVWNTPMVRFGAHGWRVELKPGLGPIAPGPHPVHPRVIAYHGVGRAGPYIVIYTQDVAWTRVLSHEIIEALVDPSTLREARGLEVEVCDPVETLGYMARGVLVSDFVTPAWFGRAFARRVASHTHRGSRFDWLGDVLRPFQIDGGFVPTLRPESAAQTPW